MEERFGKSEPILMDEEILQKAIVEQALEDQTRRIVKAEGINFNEILTLRLEYRSENIFFFFF